MKTKTNKQYGNNRVLTISEWGEKTLAHARAPLIFRGKTKTDYQSWRRSFAAKYREMIGKFPESVPLRARVVERRVFPKYIREKIILDSERYMSVPAWLCRPLKIEKGEKLPAVICCHGHGPGKDPYVGLSGNGKAGMDAHKALAVQLACHGYVVMAPDWRVFGERADLPGVACDCDGVNLLAQLLGYNLLTLDIWDGMKCIDYLLTRKEVDRRRLGCVGLSFGGTMSLHLAAADQRIAAACVSGYLAATKPLGGWGSNYGCGSQNLPGLLCWGDRAEIAGLICPRSLLIQIGRYDSTFFVHDALPAYRRLQRIYRAAGAADRLGLDLFDGCHEIHVAPILDWFDRRLK